MFKIGDFSRLARVSIKTLRHYDDEGLLAPAHIDDQTGYRYYGADQLPLLQRIRLLKELGFALAEIRALLRSDGADFQSHLDARRQELKTSIARDTARLRLIDALMTSIQPSSMTDAVSLTDIDACMVHSIRARVPTLGKPIEQLFEAAEQTVGRAHLRADASPFLIFHDNEYRERDVDVEVCIPLRKAESIVIEHVALASARAASLTYQGAYSQTGPGYAAMLEWLDRAGCSIAGPLREVYHRYGARQDGYKLPSQVLATHTHQFVTELVVPIEDVA